MPAKGSRAHGGFPGASGPVRARVKTKKNTCCSALVTPMLNQFHWVSNLFAKVCLRPRGTGTQSCSGDVCKGIGYPLLIMALSHMFFAL